MFGGIALLAYTGFGGENTDVLAHVFGFASGLVAGLVVGGVDVRQLPRAAQLLSGGAALGLLTWAWVLAGAA